MINYNTYELTRDAINSIIDHTQNLKYEIILIDNDSPDGSGEKLHLEFTDKIIFYQSQYNLGTSKAFNIGAKMASGKYVLWLNTDVILKENFILKLYDFMEENENCAICGGNILDFSGKPTHSIVHYTMDTKYMINSLNVFCRLYRKVFKKKLSYEYNYTGKPLSVMGIVGADMFIRKSVFEEVGFFDENIFMYCEETEFAYRVKKLTNYSIMSVPDAYIYHLEGASFNKSTVFSEKKYRLVFQGNCIYLNKHFGKEATLKYLKAAKKSYKKLEVLSALMFMKRRRLNYRGRYLIIKDYLTDFPGFMNKKVI